MVTSVFVSPVVECKVITFIGAIGIMIRETAETFGIISADNKFQGNLSINFVSSVIHL